MGAGFFIWENRKSYEGGTNFATFLRVKASLRINLTKVSSIFSVILRCSLDLSRAICRWSLGAALVVGSLSGLASAQSTAAAQTTSAPAPAKTEANPAAPVTVPDAGPASLPDSPVPAPKSTPAPSLAQRELAQRQLLLEEHQRILGVVPNFNTSYIPNAAPLSPKQKFQLAIHGALDPFEFVAAGLLAGYGQATDTFAEYGQGTKGYAKRFGASYADSFDGAILGNAVFPILFREDPRYYAKRTGGWRKRLGYAIATAVITKDDNGKWGPNYANVLGNIAAGGISNLYYPASDRGVELTFEGAATVTAEGAIGTVLIEFLPEIQRKVLRGRFKTGTGNDAAGSN